MIKLLEEDDEIENLEWYIKLYMFRVLRTF